MNLIENGNFEQGSIGSLPDGWSVESPSDALCPIFRLEEVDGKKRLVASGPGTPDCVGALWRDVEVDLGKTYRFSTRFGFSDDVNPHVSLLFQCFADNTQNGIFEFRRLTETSARGEVSIHFPGKGKAKVRVRYVFRFSDHGRAWVHELSLEETIPPQPRFVRVACSRGKPSLAGCRAIIEKAGEEKADVVLLPEYMQGEGVAERIDGESAKLMSELAEKYGMYVAGGIVREDDRNGRVFNTALLFDRNGNRVGTYDKYHPYSPELFDPGITPGENISVFDTDFGRVGFMICYDSWFTDVAL